MKKVCGPADPRHADLNVRKPFTARGGRGQPTGFGNPSQPRGLAGLAGDSGEEGRGKHQL